MVRIACFHILPVSIVSLLVATTVAAQPPIDETLVPYASKAHDVKLSDGREFHLVCMGEGSPTVVFTVGGISWSGEWSRVQPAIAKITRTCAWDRPGFGLSDAPKTRLTVATATADLEAALIAGQISGPYIMVGHSLGSYETLLFTDRNKEKVAGMVLVDPSIPDQNDIAKRQREQFHYQPPQPPKAGPPQPPSWSDIWRRCANEVRSGALKAGGADPHGCLAMLQPPVPPAVITAVSAKLTSNPAQYETMAAFSESGLDEGAKIVINPACDYGDIPLVVLTATALPPGDLGGQRAFWEAVTQASTQAHDDLASLSTRGINTRVPGAGHNLHIEKPRLVIDTIKTVVDQTRENASN